MKFKSVFTHAVAFVFAMVAVTGGCNYASAADEDIRIVKINDDNFEKEILQSKTPVILEVSSTSCPPCLIMIPTLISIAKNYKDIKVASIGIDEPNLDKIKNTLPIRAFPTFFFVKNGQIINSFSGAAKEEELLKALEYTPSKTAAKKPAKAAKNTKRDLTCTVNGQFNGLKNHVNISFKFGEKEIEDVNIVTDVFVPPEMESRREQMIEHAKSSGKGEVTPTMTGFQIHISNDCRFMKAMDMKRTSTYGEMRAGLELQGFTCK